MDRGSASTKTYTIVTPVLESSTSSSNSFPLMTWPVGLRGFDITMTLAPRDLIGIDDEKKEIVSMIHTWLNHAVQMSRVCKNLT
jgi:hypothetical protein